MIAKQTAADFVTDWIEAFNAHDIEKILHHYDDEVVFHSPFILLLEFNDEGIIRNKKDLGRYFAAGLAAYPDLHFELHAYFTGINTIVIYYTSVSGLKAAETFRLNEGGKAVEVFCHYTTDAYPD